MGILRDRGSRAAKVLEWLRVRAEVERVLSETPGSATSGEPAFSPELKAALEAALELQRRHHGSISTEHLLLSLLADDGSVASRILRAAGADLDEARQWARLFAGLFIATSKWRMQI
jgi:ATP-dependent Clp protease ATP-binding subunit ClpA